MSREMRSYRDDVFVYRTSSKTLKNDVKVVLEEVGLKDYYSKERRTLIKVNANYDRFYPGCNTSPWFLDALLSALKEFGFINLVVVEGDLKLQPAERTIEAAGLKGILEKHEIPFINLDKCSRDKKELPIIIHESQVINVPVIHTHTFAVISCACKNLFGLLPVDREKYHNDLAEKLLELYMAVRPCFTIVDGTVGLDGGSMRMGNPRKLDLVVAGWDPLMVDVVIARIMGFSSSQVPLLSLAEERHLLKIPTVRGSFNRYEELPCFNFRYKKSKVAKIDLWLRRNRLLGRFFKYNSLLDRLAHKSRRAILSIHYLLKKDKLLNSEWVEYRKLIETRQN